MPAHNTVNKQPAPAPVSSHGRRLLNRLAKGGRAKPDAEGGFTIGTLKAPAALITALARQELVRIDSGGNLVITAPGEALLRRAQAGAKARKDAIGADAFTNQHRAMARRKIETGGGKTADAAVNLAESPLFWLASRKDAQGRPLITPAQFDAGERLRGAYETAHRGPAVTMRWDAPPQSRMARGAPDMLDRSETQLAAKRRVEAALDAVGPGLSDILVRVCCHHEGLETAERAFGWPQRTAKIVLGIALERLAKHYGLI